MKRTVRLTAAALAAVTAMACTGVTAFANRLKTVDGVTYRYSDSGEQKGKYTGWTKTSKGRRYYKNGLPYKNKWLKMKSGKCFYFGDDGYLSVGWTHIGTDWYYITADNGRLSGSQSIDGIEYYFDDDGKWDKNAPNSTNEKHSTVYNVYYLLTSGKYNDIYGGAGILDGMLVVRSVNGQAEKLIDKRYPGNGGILYVPAEYSVSELESVRAGIKDFVKRDKENGYSYLWVGGPATSTENGRLVLQLSQEQYDRISSYLDSLPDKDCLDIRIGDFASSDD